MGLAAPQRSLPRVRSAILNERLRQTLAGSADLREHAASAIMCRLRPVTNRYHDR